MSTIGTLLETLDSLEDGLWEADLTVIEEALVDVMQHDPALTLREAVDQLANGEGVSGDDLWEGLLDLWGAKAGQQPLDEAIGDRLRRGARKVRKGARKAKNRYDRAKNSRKGRAVRRAAGRLGRAAKRAGNSSTARSAGAAALSVIGI